MPIGTCGEVGSHVFKFSTPSSQTNVYASAQRRKMSYFEGYHRKAIVVIPPHHELRKRTAKRSDEMGKEVPDDAINAMKGKARRGDSGG